LLASAAGGDVEILKCGSPPKALPEIGWSKIFIDKSNKDFKALFEDPFHVLHWHGDRILLPNKAVLIASSARCKEQFFRIGNFAYGLQFHIETTGGMINKWIIEDKEFVFKGLGSNGQEILKEENKKYIDKNTSEQFSLIEKRDNLAFLITEKEGSIYAKSFWQHTGLGLSSRAAAVELGLEDCPPKSYVNECSQRIKNRISKATTINSNDIHLTSSGMSALHTSLEIIYKLFPAKPTLQIGFPYVDVLKLPMNIFHGAKLITEENCEDIEFEIKSINPSALIIELPSNPMLKCVNNKKISKIAKKLNIPLIVDDTIGSNLNINSLEHADKVFTSLTKIFSGSGDILAGSLILNPKSKWIDQFRNALNEINIPILSDGDIVYLEKVSRDVNQRVFEQNKA